MIDNKKLWDASRISADNGPRFKSAADRITLNKVRYMEVEKKTGVPWWFIGATHYRESNLDFSTYLGNGQSLNKKTTIVPKGRGPFSTWEEGAVDALVNCHPFAAKNKDWSIKGTLDMLEKYNGLGYRNKGLPSPYLWAGTDQYSKGKYTSDGVYSATAVDKQLGTAGILKFLGVFKSGAGASTGGAGAVIVGGVATATQVPTNYIPYVVAGTLLLAFVVFIGIDIYNFKKQQNVVSVK